jgi:hypothetical protein
MIDKLDYYDTLGAVVPGALVGYWLPICFPQVAEIVAAAGFPEAVDVVAFVAAAFFLGHILQAIASALEPLLHRPWGGRPSERALERGLGDRYLPPQSADRIRAKLRTAVEGKPTDRDLFLWAMARANAAPYSRSQTFNSLYAYHRALVVVIAAAAISLLASALWGRAEEWSDARFATVLAFLLVLLVLTYYRAMQRAFYYVREVLIVAERVLDESTANRERDAGGAASKE